jgi:ParB family transcriptional regulator, chromosome partitioning protein
MANRRTLKQAYQEPTSAELANFVFGSAPATSALLSPDSVQADEFGTEIVVPLDKIQTTFSFTPTGRPVRYYYDQTELQHWAETDLKPNGIRTALWCRPLPAGEPGEYELVAGLRRLTGARLAHLDSVPIKVFDWNDEQAYAAAFDENDRRRDFSKLEEVDITLNLLSTLLEQPRDAIVSLLYRMDNAAKGKVTQDVLGSPEAETITQFFTSRAVLTWQSFVATRLPLLRKPVEILEAIRSSQIAYTKALEISKIKDEDERITLLETAIEEGLTLTEIESRVEALRSSQPLFMPPRTLKQQFTDYSNRLRKSSVWKNPDKQRKLQNLMRHFEDLLADKV